MWLRSEMNNEMMNNDQNAEGSFCQCVLKIARQDWERDRVRNDDKGPVMACSC